MAHGKLAVAVAALIMAAGAHAEPIELADGVVMIPGQVNTAPFKGPDGNTVMFRAPEGWVVFDTGRYAEHTAKSIAHARATGAPIAAVVNSHWHTDHIGGNPRIKAVFPDATVYASGALEVALKGFIPQSIANARRYMESEGANPEQVSAIEHDLAIIENPDALRPDVTIDGSRTMALAGRPFDVRVSQAASYGDVWLVDAATGIVAAGDLITLPAPFLDTACPERWTAALDELVAVPFTQVVPGHGPALDRAGVERYRDMAYRLRACAASARTPAECGDEWLATAGALVGEGDRQYVADAMGYYVGLLRNADGVAKACAGEVG